MSLALPRARGPSGFDGMLNLKVIEEHTTSLQLSLSYAIDPMVNVFIMPLLEINAIVKDPAERPGLKCCALNSTRTLSAEDSPSLGTGAP
jgi:hypothetical protein